MKKFLPGDRVRVLPFPFKLRAYWNGWYPRQESYIGCTGVVIDPEMEPRFPLGSHICLDSSVPEISITMDVNLVFVKFDRGVLQHVPSYVPEGRDNPSWAYRADQLEIV